MSTPQTATRRYVAHSVADHGHASHLVPEAASFVDAAVLYTERWHPAATEDGVMTVTVTDCDSGEQHCFAIDVDSGEIGPCAG